MHFHHLHFYVQNAEAWQRWFVDKLAFHSMGEDAIGEERYKVLKQGDIEVRLSDANGSVAAKQYLQNHPPGVVDVGFTTSEFDRVRSRAKAQGAMLLRQGHSQNGQRYCELSGWGDLRHTLIEQAVEKQAVGKQTVGKQTAGKQTAGKQTVGKQTAGKQTVGRQTTEKQAVIQRSDLLQTIDHVVINVAKGQMAIAADWYQRVFGLQPKQRFEISTAHSGLCSQVLTHPSGSLQLPINEPTSHRSQIQEFLDHNRGPGVQHAALRSPNAVGAIAHLRQRGLDLIDVPTTYYEDLCNRLVQTDTPSVDITDLRMQQVLLDWAAGGKRGALLQTFTKPIFSEPTFFFEVIERGKYMENGQIKSAQGFGEGNFQALFEAVERAQQVRGRLDR